MANNYFNAFHVVARNQLSESVLARLYDEGFDWSISPRHRSCNGVLHYHYMFVSECDWDLSRVQSFLDSDPFCISVVGVSDFTSFVNYVFHN